MFFIFIFFVVCTANGSILSKRLFVPDTKIIGGSEAPDGSIPYQASLRNGIHHFCGATVIGKRWVITAAHCAIEFPADVIRVVIGTNSLVTGGDKYSVENVFIHEEFDQSTILNDISLIKVNEDIRFSERVKPIEIADGPCSLGANVLLTGWGRTTSGDDPIPATLQMVNQTVMIIKTCQYMLMNVNVITEKQLCTFTSTAKGACQGDSGGPLVLDNKLVGIVSWGVDCDLYYPDVNTDVWSYVSWIRNKTENY
ncbi:chymotrypsin-2-like [Pieris napi]|uniref:chymotrypsin-2-like n=1 Tax=Pieris napi TaxID=78633 RepID=UPI001FB9D489|nr:chymotrypsin-2-like [Pieris napi]